MARNLPVVAREPHPDPNYAGAGYRAEATVAGRRLATGGQSGPRGLLERTVNMHATFTIFSENRADLSLRGRDAYALRRVPEYAYSTGAGIGPCSQVMDRAD